MKLYRTPQSYLVEEGEHFYSSETTVSPADTWDDLITRDDLHEYLQTLIGRLSPQQAPNLEQIQAPIGSQEVWAAGVT
jgi:2-dehydro-3-deoxy-D-arabinonate dehydratase